MNKMLIFVKMVPLNISTIIPLSFPLVEAPLNLLFWYDVKLRRHISFNVSHFLNFFL